MKCFYYYLHVCIHTLCESMLCMCGCPRKSEESVGSSGARAIGDCRLLDTVLEMELWSSTRAVIALNHWIIQPTQQQSFIFYPCSMATVGHWWSVPGLLKLESQELEHILEHCQSAERREHRVSRYMEFMFLHHLWQRNNFCSLAMVCVWGLSITSLPEPKPRAGKTDDRQTDTERKLRTCSFRPGKPEEAKGFDIGWQSLSYSKEQVKLTLSAHVETPPPPIWPHSGKYSQMLLPGLGQVRGDRFETHTEVCFCVLWPESFCRVSHCRKFIPNKDTREKEHWRRNWNSYLTIVQFSQYEFNFSEPHFPCVVVCFLLQP